MLECGGDSFGRFVELDDRIYNILFYHLQLASFMFAS